MLAGLAVVNTHPSWTRDWRVVLTIIDARGRHRAHRFTGHDPETWFDDLRIADSPGDRRYHLARARWLPQLQRILDRQIKCAAALWLAMSAIGGKADITRTRLDVCF